MQPAHERLTNIALAVAFLVLLAVGIWEVVTTVPVSGR